MKRRLEGKEPAWEGGRLAFERGPLAIRCPFQCSLAPGESRQGGLAGRPPRSYSETSRHCPIRGWGQSMEYCPTHWGFPTGLLRPSLQGLAGNSARTLTRLWPEPWSGGEEPAGILPGLSSLREGAEKVSQGTQLQQETLCPHQGKD